MDKELERFKTKINLTEYAASVGYSVNLRESCRNSVSMSHSNGDKIIIARGEDKHWIYFSIRNNQDNGSIIDFIQHRKKFTLGEVRKHLHFWMDGSLPHPIPSSFVPHVETSSKDRQGVINALGLMQNALEHPYLEFRAIEKNIYLDRRFLGRIKIDCHNNSIFPHFDEKGFCGYEIKNTGFTGFAPGGEKGLWVSNIFPEDKRLIITESAIDALSFHALYGTPDDRYVSTAGSWGHKTAFLLLKSAEKFPGNIIVMGFDKDAPGAIYGDKTREILQNIEKTLISLFPTAKDWNDDLRASYFLSKKNK